jgi:hypothetical protein
MIFSVGTEKKQFFMPTWPSLYPGLIEGKSNESIDTRVYYISFLIPSIAQRYDIQGWSRKGFHVIIF